MTYIPHSQEGATLKHKEYKSKIITNQKPSALNKQRATDDTLVDLREQSNLDYSCNNTCKNKNNMQKYSFNLQWTPAACIASDDQLYPSMAGECSRCSGGRFALLLQKKNQ